MPKNDTFRNLQNYLTQHKDLFLKIQAQGKPLPRTLTEARRIAFGWKKSQHGMLGKAINMK